ncbi:MAG: hypothetical protein ABIH70_00755 [Chloroflexota bacterium]
MGGRDYRHREAKKPKKDLKKKVSATLLPLGPTVEVEVVRKGKKHEDEEEEQE